MNPNQPTAQPAHTPIPWSVSSSTVVIAMNDPRDLAIICNTMDLFGVSFIGINEARANAKLIVRAVNAHAANEAKIAALVAKFELVLDLSRRRMHTNHRDFERVALEALALART